MKNYKYEKYDYAFLYGFLTEKQREDVQNILNKFIGLPNNEDTRNAVEYYIDKWLNENNIDIKFKIEINYE